MATGGQDGTAYVWNVATGKEISRLEHEDAVTTVAFSPDGQWVMSGSRDGTARVWSPESGTGKVVARILHADIVKAVAFGPECASLPDTPELECERYVASGSQDGAVWVWSFTPEDSSASSSGETAVTGKEVTRIEHQDEVWAMAFSADGQWVASASPNGTVRMSLWRPQDLVQEACIRLLRNLTHEEWAQYLPDEPYRATCPDLPMP